MKVIIRILVLMAMFLCGLIYYLHFDNDEGFNATLSATEESILKPKPLPEKEKTIPDSSVVHHVSEVNSGWINSNVLIAGYVSYVEKDKGHIIFQLKDLTTENYLNGILFADEYQDLIDRGILLIEGDDKERIIYVKGRICEYKDLLRIEAQQVFVE